MKLSKDVENEIADFINLAMKSFLEDAHEYGQLDLTIACSSDGQLWNFQIGDNSFTGGAYGLPHWAVTTICADDTAEDVINDIMRQFAEIETYS